MLAYRPSSIPHYSLQQITAAGWVTYRQALQHTKYTCLWCPLARVQLVHVFMCAIARLLPTAVPLLCWMWTIACISESAVLSAGAGPHLCPSLQHCFAFLFYSDYLWYCLLWLRHFHHGPWRLQCRDLHSDLFGATVRSSSHLCTFRRKLLHLRYACSCCVCVD